MQYIQRISAIEARAGAVNVTIARLCRSAGVPVSTLWRWREGLVSPTQRSLDRHLSRLEAELAVIEREVRARLAS